MPLETKSTHQDENRIIGSTELPWVKHCLLQVATSSILDSKVTRIGSISQEKQKLIIKKPCNMVKNLQYG